MQIMKDLKIPRRQPSRKFKLEEIFEIQNKINQKFYNAEILDTYQKEEWTVKQFVAMSSELNELLDSVNWKWWKENKREVNIEELRFELIDVLHFLVSTMILWEMDATDVHRYYKAKANENFDRQRRGY